MTDTTETTEILKDEAAAAETTEQPPMDAETAAKITEAILFAAGHPVSLEKLCMALPAAEETVRAALEILARKYDKGSGGVQLLMLENTAQLCTVEEYAPHIREALGIRRGGNLSRSSLEVLAIIAYNQPVTRSYIEQVRSVDSSYTVNALTEKGLIEPCGTLDTPGRPTLYRTTPDFLRIFGLSSIHELPPFELFDEKGQVLLKP